MEKVFSSQTFMVRQTVRDTVIEGWANKNIIDDAGDRVIPEGVDLTRFEKNPVIFFNHNPNNIIGKALEWKITDQGVWIRARISKSSSSMVAYVRDLIEEGILKTFSIGFMPKTMKRGEDGANHITEWTLDEVSVVSLPCLSLIHI